MLHTLYIVNAITWLKAYISGKTVGCLPGQVDSVICKVSIIQSTVGESEHRRIINKAGNILGTCWVKGVTWDMLGKGRYLGHAG